MRIGITGAAGLLGYHARAFLAAIGDDHDVVLATRETFSTAERLDGFVANLEGILHFAGINRGEDAAVQSGNIDLAHKLVEALERTGARPALTYANSTHFTRDTAYGHGKRRAGEVLEEWGRTRAARVGNFVLPHVYGEFGRPFYNSVVSTFCHQLANGQEPRIDVDGDLELIHAQAVARRLADWLMNPTAATGLQRLQGQPMRVSELLSSLRRLLTRYVQDGVVPNVDAPLDLDLFNTLRSYLYPHAYPQNLKVHTDPRGALFEAIKSDNRGQVFLSTTVPGITRGNHWHTQKVERFLVVHGEAVIRIRKLFTEEVHSFHVSGATPAFVDIPTFHVHSLTNIGEETLQTLFWTHEIFDPGRPDTYPEAVTT